jgi:6,7-dimethyl-8-ribityllumazine synthase
MHLAVERRLAIGYGILTVENEQQALVRADRKQKNKGRDAAIACLEMIKLRKKFVG